MQYPLKSDVLTFLLLCPYFFRDMKAEECLKNAAVNKLFSSWFKTRIHDINKKGTSEKILYDIVYNTALVIKGQLQNLILIWEYNYLKHFIKAVKTFWFRTPDYRFSTGFDLCLSASIFLFISNLLMPFITTLDLKATVSFRSDWVCHVWCHF